MPASSAALDRRCRHWVPSGCRNLSLRRALSEASRLHLGLMAAPWIVAHGAPGPDIDALARRARRYATLLTELAALSDGPWASILDWLADDLVQRVERLEPGRLD
jgi:hypothetical protein